MDGEYVKGQEIGKLIQGQEDLKDAMKEGFKEVKETFKSLNCSENKEKITEIYKWYSEHKSLKKFIVKQVIKTAIPTMGGVLAFVGVVYAFLKT